MSRMKSPARGFLPNLRTQAQNRGKCADAWVQIPPPPLVGYPCSMAGAIFPRHSRISPGGATPPDPPMSAAPTLVGHPCLLGWRPASRATRGSFPRATPDTPVSAAPTKKLLARSVLGARPGWASARITIKNRGRPNGCGFHVVARFSLDESWSPRGRLSRYGLAVTTANLLPE